jgi:anti-sigma factor RsiW
MNLCESIDTLAMAYLDDELATEERHELESHMTQCGSCRAHLDGERAEHTSIVRALAAPPATDLLRAKVAKALDAEDAVRSRAATQRWTRWILPGSSMAAAAAAIAVFAFGALSSGPGSTGTSAVASEAVRQASRPLPLEVQGPNTESWVHQHFASIEAPRFAEPSVQPLGARATAINGHDAVMFSYRVDAGAGAFVLTSVAMDNVRDDELDGGEAVQVGNHVLHVIQFNRQFGVTYVDPNHRGYIFFAPQVPADELVRLVATALGDH